jgi:DNA-binding response OmpR family regulator
VKPALVILDLMLPGGMDGYQVLKSVRQARHEMPVLILTARGEEADKVVGFRLGADDYVTKPFGLSELLARVNALLRRARAVTTSTERLAFGTVEVNLDAHTVTKNGVRVPLTPKEFELLITLLRRPGVVVSRPALLREVWGHQADVLTRTVDIHIAELRRKLEDDPGSPRHLVTVWKTGYRLDV